MINVSEPKLSPKTKDYVLDCIKTEWISSSGSYLDTFEKKWAKYCNKKYAVSVTSGTAALIVALKALNLKSGDEVIMPSFTIISCALAVIEAGAKPVLVDCDLDTWCIKTDEIKKKINRRTKAILIVHMFGHPANMDEIKKIIKNKKIDMIEDAAESHGSKFKNEVVGSFGKISCFSFYVNKLITTGEGGMALTNDKNLYNKMKNLRNLAFNKTRRFSHNEIGYNYRMTNIQAAIGLSQLEKIKEHIKIKRQNTFLYNKILRSYDLPISLPIEKKWAKSTFWMYGIVLKKKKMTAKTLSRKLFENKIETRPLFLGMHEQPVFKKLSLFKSDNYPNTEYLSKYGLYLPSGLRLNKSKIELICKTLKSILSEK
ncbi:MAG: aminotransferase DegT [Rickettsiales bacterium]|nr:aminotransferase DegT [Rickettsiales bacterium]